MAAQVRHEAADAARRARAGSDSRVDPRTGRPRGTAARGLGRRASGTASSTRRSSGSPTPDPPTVTTQSRSSSRVAERRPQTREPVARSARARTRDVAGEVEVLLRPRRGSPAAPGRTRRRRRRRVADEDRPVAHRPEPGPLLDHLGVVVRGQRRLRRRRRRASAASRRSRSTRRTANRLSSRVLVQEVVDVPRLVADHEVVVLRRGRRRRRPEVVDQDLVHPADRLEGVQVVLGRLVLDVGATRWPASADAGWTRSPAAPSTAVTGSWASQSICRSGCSVRSSSAIARSRRAWPSPIGEDR